MFWDAAIFDLDGTLADCGHRLHYLDRRPKDWDGFAAAAGDDEPYGDMVELAAMYRTRGYKIVLCTGRGEGERDLTTEWLQRHDIPWDALYMRSNGDYRGDHVVKPGMLPSMRIAGYAPRIVFEDRSRVVDAWREVGLRCLQVAHGGY